MSKPKFDKYEKHGDYHWQECDPRASVFNPPLVARYQIVLDCLGQCSAAADIGCGDGYLLGKMAGYCGSVIGVEYESAAVDLAREHLGKVQNVEIRQGSAYKLPVNDESLDVVVMADVIEHFETPEIAVAEARRVLKKNGRLIVTTPKWRPDKVWDAKHVIEFKPHQLRAVLSSSFGQIQMSYFWPLLWSNFYSTRLGWKVMKPVARHLFNPFLQSGAQPEKFGQILALCSR